MYFDVAKLSQNDRDAYNRLNEVEKAEYEALYEKLQSIARKPVIFGYARVSTNGQAKDGNSLEAQNSALAAAGATKIYSDAYTGTTMKRPEFEKLRKDILPGDTLVVTKLDRIARSLTEGSKSIKELMDNGITVNVLNLGILDNTPTGRLMLSMMLAFAEFERDMIMQRTREGKNIAKKNPNFREGRPPKYSDKQMQHAIELLKDHSYNQVVELTGISKATLARAKNKVE